ncbi:Cyclopropane-fatty-acyl-phospholipid synthase [Leminorella richardii]|uniref:Cyclopropane-fatty-acyl-phospholipid synthase n=1 Tax=Leminorella richardii TaxID=158841 RepID=A0A2X4VAE6_9GAMM|nr:cyclopropane fatty acyl phospholipid synthase [Leminorella richardii]SQI42280.1 Cyclopropane-fatty-acyl-phospholipid synthase [Leminorella richardii]
MSSSSIEDIGIQTSSWYRMADELLQKADIRINGLRPFDIQVHHPQFFKRVLRQGSMGLGESYMDGWWDCSRLDIFFHRILRAGLESCIPKRFSDLMRLAGARIFNLQSTKRAWMVGRRHYDLGNDLFNEILDPYMQYSCGYWKNASTLEQAQQDKLKMICEKLQLRPGLTLLDIGCGWGGLAAYAAKHYGVSVHGVTISAQQQKLAQARCCDLDVNIILQDYRDLHNRYDRIVSVGMFEHVGPKNYDTYFKVTARNLKPNGLFLLHTIGSKKTKANVDPWINRYIFPNGCLPSVANLSHACERHFVIEDLHNFGADYDPTLMAWYQRFIQNWDRLAGRYDERFKRMFSYYLNACAGAFRARDIQLWQVLLSPNGVEGGLRVPR